MERTRPVKASLYSRVFGINQSRLFLASISQWNCRSYTTQLAPSKSSDVQVCHHNPLSRLGLPLVPWDVLVDTLGYPTFLHVFGTDETVLWNPMCTAAQANPMCPSYPTVLCGTDGTVLWNPTTVQPKCIINI